MKNFIVIIMIFLLKSSVSSLELDIKHFRTHEEAEGRDVYALDFIGLVERNGRRAEWHNVTTEDGYILPIFRILQNSNDPDDSKDRPVVYLQHALLATADIFIMWGPGRSLAYLLIDAGYDVWLGNLRGNIYTSHEKIPRNKPEFWNFSMDEYALIDLPTMLDYILETTKQESLTYVGHSLGSTIVLMLLSEKTEYNEKLKPVIHLAPVAFWINQSWADFIWDLAGRFFEIVEPSGEFNVGYQTTVFPFFFEHYCMANRVTLFSCRKPFEIWFGADLEPYQIAEMPKLLSYYPAGGSARVLYHYGQHIRSGQFQYYDYYGKNIEYYGQTEAPIYNVTKITAMEIIFAAKKDRVATEANVEYLLSQLPDSTKIIYYIIQNEKFDHRSFVIFKDVDKELNIPILKILNNLRNNAEI